MKIFLTLCLVLATVYAKKELKGNNCEGSFGIVTLVGLEDSKSGAVCRHSVLSVKVETDEDTSEADPFTITADVVIKKYVVFGYVTIPDATMDLIGADIMKKYGPTIKYLGNGKFLGDCIFKSVGGHCLPAKGTETVKFPFAPLAEGLKEVVGKLANGWFKVSISGNTDFEREAFCFDLELKIDVET